MTADLFKGKTNKGSLFPRDLIKTCLMAFGSANTCNFFFSRHRCRRCSASFFHRTLSLIHSTVIRFTLAAFSNYSIWFALFVVIFTGMFSWLQNLFLHVCNILSTPLPKFDETGASCQTLTH